MAANRDSAEQRRVYGLHAVQAALRGADVTDLWVDAKRHDARLRAVLSEAEQRRIRVHAVGRAELDALAQGARHQGVVAELHYSSRSRLPSDLPALLATLSGPPLILVLDGVQDPHNLGACLRTAAGAGAHAVVAPADRAVALTATVRKVASGAAEVVPFIQVVNLARALRDLQQQGLWIVGADGEAERPLYAVDLRGPLAIVLGAEGKGLRRLTRDTCDVLACIPMAGGVKSLNVSVAAGVFLFEALRQRQ
ncbi:MAG: 23S rRNA (guanosine(2251)-2'-O)-methyltransferase RlmB [Gammaproteobacteria bacterium]